VINFCDVFSYSTFIDVNNWKSYLTPLWNLTWRNGLCKKTVMNLITLSFLIRSQYVCQYKLNFVLFGSLTTWNSKRLSLFLQIWTRKCVYISWLTCTSSDSIRSCQKMHRNAPGGQILYFRNIIDMACDEIRLEIQSRIFFRKSNFNGIRASHVEQ